MAAINERKHYENFELPNTLLDSLNDMRNNGDHCDIVLLVEDERFEAHRVVLAASSSYFRAMFSSSSCFNETEKREICLDSVDKVAVIEILQYFYTGKIELNNSNFEDVFALANLWDVSFIVNVCSEDFLRSELDVSNCLGIQFLATKYQTFSSSFRHLLDKFIWKNFMAVCKDQEFLSLSVERLANLLKNDVLKVKSEEVVFEAVLRWISHDRQFRQQYTTQLVQQVRLGLLSPSYLTGRVLSEELIQQTSNCKNLVEQVIKLLQPQNQALPLRGMTLNDLAHFSKKRKTDALYIFGGYVSITGGQKNEATVVEYLDCAMGNHFLEQFSPIRVGFSHVVSFSDYLFFIGHNNLKRFNRLSLTWEDLFISSADANALDATNAGVCTCLESIFVIGGPCHRSFHPATNLWRDIEPPGYEHYRPGLCCLGGRIFVIGGCDKYYQESVSYVERFDPNKKSWEVISPLPTPRWGPGAVVLNNMIYAVGGYDTDNHHALNTVEVYSPDKDTWASVASLVNPRRRFGIAVVNGTIYVAGGYNEGSVEWFDEENDTWRVLEGVKVNRHDCRCLALPVQECW